jgi:hypothetical protein
MKSAIQSSVASRKLSVLVLILVLASIMVSCGRSTYIPNAPQTETWSTPISSPIPTLTPVGTSQPTPTPIRISLDYFAIKSTHQPLAYLAPNTIQLYAVVDDGRTSNRYAYPSTDEGVVLGDFQLVDLGRQSIFNTPSVVAYLRVSILAYSSADRDTTLGVLRALQTFEPGLGPLSDFYAKLPQQKELIGYYEHTWDATENWGASSTGYKGENGDLTVWFRIWSTTEPAAIGKPTFGPDVKIDVTLPSNVKKRSPSEIAFVITYPTTIRLQNNEAVDVTVDVSIEGQGRCLDVVAFTGGTVTIPKYGHKDITTSYCYETAGARQVKYTVSYGGNVVASWTGTLTVNP